MRNYSIKFSTLLPLRNAEAVTQALDLLKTMRAEAEDKLFESDLLGFEAEAKALPDSELQHLWIYHNNRSCEEDVITFARACCEKRLTLPVRWSLIWTGDWSKPDRFAYRGGAIVLDLATGNALASLDLTCWAHEIEHSTHQMLDADREASAQVDDLPM